MSNVKVEYGDNAAGVASQLLAAARSLDMETSVVKTTSDNVFLVPEEVADKAGLSYELEDGPEPVEGPEGVPAEKESMEVPAGTLEERIEWVADAEDQSEATKRASAVWTHEVDSGAEQGDLDDLAPKLHTAVYGKALDPDDDDPEKKVEPELPIGKALAKALKDAGLPTSGNKADKQARLAEHLNKE